MDEKQLNIFFLVFSIESTRSTGQITQYANEMLSFMTCHTNRCTILNRVAPHKLQRKVRAARMHRVRIAYNNRLIITVRGIIITHGPRKLARSVIVVFHLISVPAIVVRVGPRVLRGMRFTRARNWIGLSCRPKPRGREESPIVEPCRGALAAIHQRHVNAFRCWFAAGVITLFIKFHHPRASAARDLPRRQSRKRPELWLPRSAVWFAVIRGSRYNPVLRWCTRFIVYLRVAWLSITVLRSGRVRLP